MTINSSPVLTGESAKAFFWRSWTQQQTPYSPSFPGERGAIEGIWPFVPRVLP